MAAGGTSPGCCRHCSRWSVQTSSVQPADPTIGSGLHQAADHIAGMDGTEWEGAPKAARGEHRTAAAHAMPIQPLEAWPLVLWGRAYADCIRQGLRGFMSAVYAMQAEGLYIAMHEPQCLPMMRKS